MLGKNYRKFHIIDFDCFYSLPAFWKHRVLLKQIGTVRSILIPRCMQCSLPEVSE